MRILSALPPLALAAILSSCAHGRAKDAPPVLLPEFTAKPSTHEQELALPIPSGGRILLDAAEDFDPKRPTSLVIFALPNGNTIEWTAGLARTEGMDWHYDIQHIAAQTRTLREALPERNFVVAYLEADKKSWPSWRKARPDSSAQIVALVDDLAKRFPAENTTITLTGHSGGGSFTFGYLNGVDTIPTRIERIALLDSNYAFAEEDGHGTKLVNWLKADASHRLFVLAYDDREITLNGKKVVSDTGGTWRACDRMLVALGKEMKFAETDEPPFLHHAAPQVDFYRHRNPDVKILHTVLVEKNGYLNAMTRGTSAEGKVGALFGDRFYTKWIEAPAPAATPAPETKALPARPADAPTGSQFIEKVKALPIAEREAAVLAELRRGNIPDFLRNTVTVKAEATGLEGKTHTVAYEAMPDYLGIGSDADWVRMPMTPKTAEAFCAEYDYVLPTRKMVNDIWKAAEVKLEPQPMTEAREAPETFLAQNKLIEEQRAKDPSKSKFVAGIKKDVVVTNRLNEKPGKVAIYGWHYRDGKPIQPLTIVHGENYVDYSHGIRPVRREMLVDGVNRLPFREIAADPHLNGLVSDEGELVRPTYEVMP